VPAARTLSSILTTPEPAAAQPLAAAAARAGPVATRVWPASAALQAQGKPGKRGLRAQVEALVPVVRRTSRMLARAMPGTPA